MTSLLSTHTSELMYRFHNVARKHILLLFSAKNRMSHQVYVVHIWIKWNFHFFLHQNISIEFRYILTIPNLQRTFQISKFVYCGLVIRTLTTRAIDRVITYSETFYNFFLFSFNRQNVKVKINFISFTHCYETNRFSYIGQKWSYCIQYSCHIAINVHRLCTVLYGIPIVPTSMHACSI